MSIPRDLRPTRRLLSKLGLCRKFVRLRAAGNGGLVKWKSQEEAWRPPSMSATPGTLVSKLG